MSYPKPLTERSLARLYRQANITDEQSAYLHAAFEACANLYGVIALRNAWPVIQAQENRPALKRKDVIAFSAIARREVLPYLVYEVDDVFPDEKNSDLSRMIVTKELVGAGYGKHNPLFRLLEYSYGFEAYVPENLLDYTHPAPTPEEHALRDYLDNLIVTAKEYKPPYGDPIPCENQGMRLCEFSFLNQSERFDYKYLQPHSAQLKLFLEEVGGTESEKIFRGIRRCAHLGMEFDWILKEFAEVGVVLDDKETLSGLLHDYRTTSHLWYIHGHSPADLARPSRWTPDPQIQELIRTNPKYSELAAQFRADGADEYLVQKFIREEIEREEFEKNDGIPDLEATRIWNSWPEDRRQLYLHNAYCSHCHVGSFAPGYIIRKSGSGIIVEGKCAACGEKIRRFCN